MLRSGPRTTKPGVLVLRSALLVLAPLAGQEGASEAREGLAQRNPAQLGALAPQLSRAEDMTDAGLAFVELSAARDTYLLGEPFALRLRLGLERDLLASLVQLFQRPLDVPVQVLAPALEELDGARFLDAGEAETGASFALGERITRAARLPDLERDGRTYAVFEYERLVAGSTTGELQLTPPRLAFARASRFEEDFVLGRVPVDRKEGLVRGAGGHITIAPLPEEGRPAEFSGAVGSYTIHATAEPRELAEGESLKLTVRVQGRGDLSHCEAPSLDGLADFRLQGTLVERSAAELVATYDLAPLDAGVRAVPPVHFAYFDTTPPAGYRTVETQPIALVVRATERAPAQPAAAEPEPEPEGRPILLAAALVLLALLALGVLLARRRLGPSSARPTGPTTDA